MKALQRFRTQIRRRLERWFKARWLKKQIQATGGNVARGSARRHRQAEIKAIKDALIIDLMTRHRLKEIKPLSKDEWNVMEYNRISLPLSKILEIKRRVEE